MQQIIQPGTVGILSQELASPGITGSQASNDMVASFLGSTDTLFAAPVSAAPVVKADSALLGSTFKIALEGVWVVKARIVVAPSVTVNATIGIDTPPALLNTDNVDEDATALDIGIAINPAGTTSTIKLISAPFIVTRNVANNPTLGLVRLLLGNTAGAPPASAALLAAQCSIRITRVGGLPGV